MVNELTSPHPTIGASAPIGVRLDTGRILAHGMKSGGTKYPIASSKTLHTGRSCHTCPECLGGFRLLINF
jgi:hypothetical protein